MGIVFFGRWRTLLGGAVVSLVFLALAAVFAAHEHSVYRQFAIDRLMQQTVVLSNASTVMLTEVDQALKYVVSDGERALGAPDFNQKIFGALATARHTTSLPNSIFALDGLGRLMATGTSMSPNPYPLGDVDYAKAHIENAHAGVFVGSARQGRLGSSAGKWLIGLSRAIRNEDGSLAAIIVATVLIESLVPVLTTGYGTVPGVGVWAAPDGTVLLRNPFVPEALSTEVDAQRTYYRDLIAQSSKGAVELVSSVDDVRRLVAWQASDNFPIVSALAVEVDDVMAEWNRTFNFGLVAAGLFCVLLVGAGYAADRLRLASARAQQLAADRFELLLEGIQDIFVAIDANMNLTAFNAAAIDAFGGAADRMRGRSLFEFFPEMEEGTALAALRSTLKTGQRTQVQLEQASTAEILSIHIYPFIGGVAIIAERITDRLAIEGRLHQAQKMEALGQLTGGIAHDFNNLLTVIMGNAEALLDNPLSESGRRNVEGVIHGTEQAAELTKQLLAFARQQPLVPRSVDLNRQIEGMQIMIRRVLSESISFKLDLTPELWAVWVDPNQLESALLNIFLNARDAMPNGGAITVETSKFSLEHFDALPSVDLKAGHYVKLSITDNGIGMGPDVVARAFDPFFSTKPEGRGTGLGLSMVYGFVRQSGGQVTLDSEPGAGTTINLYLPRSLQDFSSSYIGRTEADQKESIHGGTEEILIVEDNPLVREFTRNTLRQLGYKTVEISDAGEALALFDKGRRFDLVLSDIVLPGEFSGPAMVEELRSRGHQFALLFMSGYPKTALRDMGRLAEVEIIGKPFKRSDLARTVRAAIGRFEPNVRESL